MRNIFVAFSPYHILLSSVIALDRANSGDNYLFATCDSKSIEVLLQTLEECRSPFTEVKRLLGVYNKSNMFIRGVIIKKNIIFIKHFVERNKITHVYVFADSRGDSQAALYYSKINNPNVKGIYVEDGAAAYSSRKIQRSKLKVLLAKLWYGYWWEDTRVYGESRWIDEVKVIFPQLIRPELRPKNITGLSRDTMLALRKQDWFNKYLKKLGIRATELGDLDAILVVARSEFAKGIPQYKRILGIILDFARDQRLRFAIKYHPRELENDYLSIADTERAIILPQSLPIEAVYILASRQIRLVVGDISTSLLTAKWLLDDAKVISIAPILNYADQHLLRVFHDLGIRLARNAEEIAQLIRR